MKKAILIAFLFLAIQAAVPAVGAYVINFSGKVAGDASGMAASPSVMGVELLCSYLLMLGALYAWRLMPSAASPVSGRKAVPLAMAAMLPLIAAANIVSEMMGLPDLSAAQMPALMRSPLCVVCIALAGPLTEEMVFRRAVIGSLTEGGYGRAVAIAVSALLFALVHINPAQMPAALIIGLLLGWLYMRSGSIIVPMACHVLNNVLSVVLFHATPDAKLTESLGGFTTALPVAAVCAAACFFLVKAYARLVPRQANEMPDDLHKIELHTRRSGMPLLRKRSGLEGKSRTACKTEYDAKGIRRRRI